MTKYARAHDMDSWLRDPRIAARGTAHRWQSLVAAGNGEDAFIALVEQYLRPDCDVLDLGCGHGELTLILAARCRTIVGIEREPGYLELARELAAERNVANVQFFQANLAGVDDEDRVFAGIPLADDSIDLFVNRRGPMLRRYLDEALRVARPGAVIVGLHPGGNGPAPIWCDQLPEPYQRAALGRWSFDETASWVTDPLRAAGISDYSLWWLDVPEFLRTPHELYVRLSITLPVDAPAYQTIEPQLTRIFKQYSTPEGIILRHQQLLWHANLPGAAKT
jgi:SAM-dependent methyltransferase